MEKMIKCGSCGAEFPAAQVRCPYCGTADKAAAENEYKGRVVWDKKSVRIEEIPGGPESEVVVSECKSCGSSICMTKGFTDRCPYCHKAMEG